MSSPGDPRTGPGPNGPRSLWSVNAIAEDARRAPGGYAEFLRVEAMSAGVYVLPRGATDTQTPHGEDEVYFVVRGRSRFHHGDRDDRVGPGDVLFVPAREIHRFHSIEEELVLLVLFAPAERPVPPGGPTP